MQANYALNGKLRYSRYLFNKWIDKDANTLILPNLSSGNITHKILQTIGPHEAIGPIHILQRTAIAVINAQASSNQEH
nr:phosphate acyltransferase [uncultured Draconibacterium sp.]